MKMTVLVFAGLVSSVALAGVRQAVWPEGRIPDFQEHQFAATTKEAGEGGFDPKKAAMP